MEALENRPFLAFLSQLEAETVRRLYESKPACLAILRMLPPLAQKCVLIMVFRSEGNLLEECNKNYKDAVEENIRLLRQLHILSADEPPILNIDFRMNYLQSLMRPLAQVVGLDPVTRIDEKVQKAASRDLYKKALERWECVLSYLALPDSAASVSMLTVELFEHIGFIKRKGNGSARDITSLGFQFLLLGRAEQIWSYLMYYLKYIEVTTEDVFPFVEFFLRLCLCVDPSDLSETAQNSDTERLPATPYLIDDKWPEIIKTGFLKHLRELGLVFIRKSKDGFFFITPLMALLLAGDGERDVGLENTRQKGFLIAETNYRLAVYSNSHLHLSILNQFAEIVARFNNMAVGLMSRDTVRQALQRGITAKQITQYLRANSHPRAVDTHGQYHCVPPTVVDQIHLWEEERERLQCQDCAVYSLFDSDEQYVQLKNFATERGFLLYGDDIQRVVVVTNEGNEMVREWYHALNESRIHA
ncbi:unnamed protein product [Bursaphelenchus xylophilus]|uniref:General transcription factor IIH subunit 4 n=1 Tax=Bursaphelenchus xylophilus TaxID=6326 RepID=A0A1I7SB87_BURXY|nr:unnamed protein product [Bursaphelenchus xylophilus]CAG9118659.1 unnamed protein product [Bursaphelenchus xylophilus]